jgi:hypothetical protein
LASPPDALKGRQALHQTGDQKLIALSKSVRANAKKDEQWHALTGRGQAAYLEGQQHVARCHTHVALGPCTPDAVELGRYPQIFHQSMNCLTVDAAWRR